MKISSLFRMSRVKRNAGWLIGGNIVNKLVAFIVNIWTARYLGPSNYGLINYAAAYTTLFFSLCTLGINSVIVKELIDHSDDEGTTMGTTLVLQGASSLLSIGMICLIVFFLNSGEKQTLLVTFLCSLGLFFQMMDSLKYWFQSKLESKYAAIATTVAYTISSLYKVVLLITGKSVVWFAIATSVDYLCVAIILYATYRKMNGPRFRFSKEKAKSLFFSSYHFILSGLMISIYGATDKLMLKNMMDESAVGYYGTAVSICNVWVFILAAIIDSYKPVITELHNTNYKEFENKNIQLYSIVFYCSVTVSLLITVFAQFGINLLYGKAYLPAVQPLRIITWYVAFSYLGVARDTWIVCERKQKYLPLIYMGAAVTNVILNTIMIPNWNASGAAFASLVTQISTVFVFPLIIKDFRPNVKLMTRAVMLKRN